MGDLQGLISYVKQYPDIIKAVDDNNKTLLYLAARLGNMDCVLFLLDAGSDINHQIDVGSTPLHGASFAGFVEIVELLLKRGADPTIRNKYNAIARDEAKIDKIKHFFDIPPPKETSALPNKEVFWQNLVKESIPTCNSILVPNPDWKIGQAPNIILNPSFTKRIRIVCLSDTHTRHLRKPVPNGDILIHAGDFTNNGSPEQFQAFNDFLCMLPHRHKVVISGNHEAGLKGHSIDVIRKKMLPYCIYLQDSGVMLEGIRIWGSPWTGSGPAFWAQQDSGEMAQKWEQIPSSTDILVTHSPPFNIIDLAFMEVENPSNEICNTCGQAHPNFFSLGKQNLAATCFSTETKSSSLWPRS